MINEENILTLLLMVFAFIIIIITLFTLFFVSVNLPLFKGFYCDKYSDYSNSICVHYTKLK